MKRTRIIICLLALLICTLSCVMTGCREDDIVDKNQVFTVTFRYDDGSVYRTAEVKYGETVAMPKSPTMENYTFVGWFLYKSGDARYDFSKEVTNSFSLYARFELDAAGITNEISQNTMKSVVTIRVKYYNTFLGIIETGSLEVVFGSGFCFEISDGYYYVLTNCHVAVKHPDYDYVKYTIVDYKGNEYTGYLYENPNNGEEAISPDYDLACIYFKASSSEVEKLELAKKNPEINDDVISLGTPDGQTNSITYGKVSGYEVITLEDCEPYRSNVKFEVIRHDAGRRAGSSGGPVLSSELKVIGVNYAAQEGVGPRGHAIPIERVWEFLNRYVYN